MQTNTPQAKTTATDRQALRNSPTIGRLLSHKAPAVVPMPSPTPDASPIVAHQENTLKGQSYVAGTVPHHGSAKRGPSVPVLTMTRGAHQEPTGLSLKAALAQVPKAGRAAKVAAMVAKPSKRHPVTQAPVDLEPGAYIPLVKTPGGAKAQAARATMKANEAAAVALAASLAPAGADGPAKARAKKEAYKLLAAVVVARRVPAAHEVAKGGETPGNVDPDAPLAVALSPRAMADLPARAHLVAKHTATVEGRHHLGRMPRAPQNPGKLTVNDL